MKTLLAFTLSLLSLSAISQPAIEWQNTIGGDGRDTLLCIRQTSDGGYIAAGYSWSTLSGDKTENSTSTDYWIVKLNAAGGIQWQNTIGGSGEDRLADIRQTADGGYIVGGSSYSDISGDKTENRIGLGHDYWILKLDAAGNIQWQNTIGGSRYDFCVTIQQTADGGYIAGGHSDSDISGDKTENSLQGRHDYWIVKLDATGNIQWQNTIGGTHEDFFTSLQQTSDGGYILGGSSLSGISGDKTEPNLGASSSDYVDFWVVKVNATGAIVWDNTIGGDRNDALYSVIQTIDGGYLLGGHSDSPISDDKTENSNTGLGHDYWIVKLSTSGNVEWQNTITGLYSDYLYSVAPTSDGGYILGGNSNSPDSLDKSEDRIGWEDIWVVKINASGSILWEKTIGGTDYNGTSSIQQTADGGFIIGGTSHSDISGDKTENSLGGKDYWIIKLAPETTTTCNASFTYTIQQTTYTFQNTSTGSNLTYLWDFNDGNFSALQNPVHTFLQSGTYNICLTTSDTSGCNDVQCNSITIVISSNLVWPGDANSDGIANNFDLFAIGIGFGISGPTRTNATNNWIGQTATDWQLQLAGGANLKHVDCDGNGTIGFSDVDAIQQNYGLTHSKGDGSSGRANGDLFLVFPLDSFFTGDTITGEIHLGAASAPVSNVYGIAFSLTYNENIVDSGSFRMDFVNSWMAPDNNRISLTKDLYAASKIDAGLSRINHSNISGAGKIADVSFVIQDNIDGKDHLTLPLELQFENVQAIDRDEAAVGITSTGDTLFITDKTTGLKNLNGGYGVTVFPNPAQGRITVLSEVPVESYSMFDITGKEVFTVNHQASRQFVVDLTALHPGVYFITLRDAAGSAVQKKIVVSR